MLWKPPSSPPRCRVLFFQLLKMREVFKRGFFHDPTKLYRHPESVLVFHPDPADLLTLQFMVGLEQLSSPQKRLLFETLFTHLKDKTFHLGCFIIQTAMESLKKPLPQLDKLEFIETTDAFKQALVFLKQKGVISTIPTVEINGKIRDEYPSRQFLVKQFEAKGANP